MEERLVDVLNDNNHVLHVFPVKLDAPDAPVEALELEAVKAAIETEIVPPKAVRTLKARPHVSRGGPLTPYGDALQIKHEQAMRLETRIRDRSYFLWLDDGCPDGRADEYWHRACQIEASLPN